MAVPIRPEGWLSPSAPKVDTPPNSPIRIRISHPQPIAIVVADEGYNVLGFRVVSGFPAKGLASLLYDGPTPILGVWVVERPGLLQLAWFALAEDDISKVKSSRLFPAPHT